MARTLIASDNFNRTDASSLGANWTDLFPGWATADINTNRAVAADGSQSQTARWAGTGTFSDDQYSKVTITTRYWGHSGYRSGVIARASADTDANRDYYFLIIYHDQDIGQPVTTIVGKCVNGTESALVTDTSIAWVATDTIELEVTTVGGNAQLRCYRNGTVNTALNHTDSTSPLTTGKPGIYLQGEDNIAIDDWEGGDVTSSSGATLSGSAVTSSAGAQTAVHSVSGSGSAVTSAQETIAAALSVAIVGVAITLASGLVSPNNDGTVPLVGAEITSQSGTVIAPGTRALTGEAITAAQTAPSIGFAPTTVSGQAVTASAGTVTAEGNSVNVNISGVESVFDTGFVQGGTQAIGGLVVTGELGAYGLSLTLSISGAEITSAAGTLAPAQEADDTYITSQIGSTTPSMSVALVGAEVSLSQGTIAVTNDIAIELTGAESTSAAGTMVVSATVPATGEVATFAQQTVGAPGGATLSGAVITAAAGDVLLTADREYALIGTAVAAQAGDTFASPLAFVDGAEITVIAQEIGPREVTLVGESISTATGDVSVPAQTHRSAVSGKHRKNYLYKGKRYYLALDELARMILSDPDITRDDIKVAYKNQKPHPIGKKALQDVVEMAKTLPKTDDQDIEDLIALL